MLFTSSKSIDPDQGFIPGGGGGGGGGSVGELSEPALE